MMHVIMHVLSYIIYLPYYHPPPQKTDYLLSYKLEKFDLVFRYKGYSSQNRILNISRFVLQ